VAWGLGDFWREIASGPDSIDTAATAALKNML
jgi:hypothetical protein